MRSDRSGGTVPTDGVSPPQVLVDAGLLTRDKRGVWAYYAIVPGALDVLADLLRTPSGTGSSQRSR